MVRVFAEEAIPRASSGTWKHVAMLQGLESSGFVGLRP